MGQYQSFPGTPGSSQSLEKLRALCLPQLEGRAFLDVGCNEGFFCGYARWSGAARAVGIDRNAASIARAQQRFPDCEFLRQSWDRLPPGRFDVILLASALHYAQDQPALIHRLMQALAPAGTLVMEVGVHPSEKSEWVNVKRGIDERMFASLPKLKEVLRHYAWTAIGKSVMQRGDPVPRMVLHVRHRRPIAYLLMEPSGYGKSSLARILFQPAGIRVVGGDSVIHKIGRGKAAADPALDEVIRRDYSHRRINKATERIFEAGLGGRLVELFAAQAGGGDFALDAYVPVEHHAEVVRALEGRGYLPVTLEWERVAKPSTSQTDADERARAYFATLAGGEAEAPAALARPLPFKGTKICIDEISLKRGRLHVKGWALDCAGAAPAILALEVDGTRHVFERYEVRPRPDVQKHYSLPHASCGYLLTLSFDQSIDPDELKSKVSLYGGQSLDALSGPFRK